MPELPEQLAPYSRKDVPLNNYTSEGTFFYTTVVSSRTSSHLPLNKHFTRADTYNSIVLLSNNILAGRSVRQEIVLRRLF